MWLVILAIIGLGLGLLATSPDPWVAERRDPTAEQVEMARSAFRTARLSRSTGKPAEITMGSAEVDAAATMISRGFAPYRLHADVEGDTLTLTVSRPLPIRWVNVRLQTSGESEGFPRLSGRVGAIPLPAWLAKIGISTGRRLLIMRGANLPPLDELVTATRIADGRATGRIMLPSTGLIDMAAGDDALRLDDAKVAKLYCELTELQRSKPDPSFAHQLGRALEASEATPSGHATALVALAMLAVDPSIGELAGKAQARVANCEKPPIALRLQGRTDSPMHWALSAALKITAGDRLSVAMGEWKELADSLSSNPFLAANDRSGFSFVDLAADRSGILTAQALIDPERMAATRKALLKADDERLLPKAALELEDGIPNQLFVAEYGGTDDPRFTATVRHIDALLKRSGVE